MRRTSGRSSRRRHCRPACPPAAIASRARRAYSPTLTVEECGARTSPITRSTPAARSSPAASSIRGAANLAPPTTVNRPGALCSRAAADAGHLGPGELVQRGGPPDGPVAALELGQLLGRGGPAPADLGVEGPDLLERPGRAVGHDEHAGGRPRAEAPVASSGLRHRRTELRGLGVDVGDQPLEDRRVGLGQDSVTEIEDVAGPAASVPSHRGPRPGPGPTTPDRWSDRGCPARRSRARSAAGPRRAAPASRPRRHRPRPRP